MQLAKELHLLNELLLCRRYISTQDFRCTNRCVIAWYFFRKSFSESVEPRRSVISRLRSENSMKILSSFSWTTYTQIWTARTVYGTQVMFLPHVTVCDAYPNTQSIKSMINSLFRIGLLIACVELASFGKNNTRRRSSWS